jgi:hypothetical protein
MKYRKSLENLSWCIAWTGIRTADWPEIFSIYSDIEIYVQNYCSFRGDED